MGKRHRYKASSTAIRHVSDAAVATTNDGFSTDAYLLMSGGFQAGAVSPSRGYIYWPTLDTRRQMNTLTREEIAKRIQWLYNHFGFARRLVNGMARLLGFLTPQPNTSDDEWNEMAFDSFMAIAGSAEIYDVAGKFDFFESQVQDNISIFRDGDGLAVLTESQAGRARVAYYEAHQLRNPDTAIEDWFDGCRLSDHGRHVGYCVVDGEDTSILSEVDAKDAIYFANFENRGQVRPTSILATAVLNMIDVVETRGFTKHALKAHSRIGTVIEQEMANVMMPMPGGMGGPILQFNQSQPDGSVQPVNMEMVYHGAQTPRLPPGARVKVIADDRPSPNKMEFEKAILQDCVWTADLSFQLLCDIGGITGPGIRYLNSELKRWILLKQYRQAKRCNRFYNYTVAKEIKAGRLREPKGLRPGEYWWNKTQWIGLPVMDIDTGHTSQATLIELQSGLTTWLNEWGNKGVFWKRGIRQAVWEIAYAKLECHRVSKETGIPVTAQEVFPQRFSIMNQQLASVDPKKLASDPELPDPDDPPNSEN